MAIERILVPIDFSELSLKALDEACEFSRPYEAELIILFVVERGYYESPLLVPDSGALFKHRAKVAGEKLSEIIRRVRERGINCRALVEFGNAHAAIIEVAKKVKADLTVISTHGRTGLAHLLIGGTAEKVVRRSACPVLVVPALAMPRWWAGTRSRRAR